MPVNQEWLEWLQVQVVSQQSLDRQLGGLMFYRGFFLLRSFFFFRQLLSALAEQNSTKTGHMLGTECDSKMYVRNLGYPIPLQTRAPKPPFFDHFTT